MGTASHTPTVRGKICEKHGSGDFSAGICHWTTPTLQPPSVRQRERFRRVLNGRRDGAALRFGKGEKDSYAKRMVQATATPSGLRR